MPAQLGPVPAQERLASAIGDFLADLTGLQARAPVALGDVTTDVLRAYFTASAHLRPATRARKHSALASFIRWAVRQERLATDPMARLDHVRLPDPEPRGVSRATAEAILAAIPVGKLRDRLLFRLLLETGLRIGEALALHVEDLDLRPDEHLRVLVKGGRRRTILLDDPALVHQLSAYLKRTGYRHGPLFRAEKNSRGGSLRYQSAQELWARYRARAGRACTLHQLRHTHATELVNDGVGLATIRKRLGHRQLQTTLRYAEQSDATADAELRLRRR